MGKMVAGLAFFLMWSVARAGEPIPRAIDARLRIDSFRLGKEPASTDQIVFARGRAYVFPSGSKEVVIVEPAREMVGLVDVGRKVQTEVSFRTIDESLEKLKGRLRGAAEALEAQGGRANLLEAKMSRDLFETPLEVSRKTAPDRIHLANPAVEVDAEGTPESDALLLARVAETLSTIAKLGAFRTPDDLPPFAELEAIAALTGDRKLRPTELTYLYRLAGPPRKFRRTYKRDLAFTDRDVEALDRVDQLREVVPHLRYERYRATR